jgi:hypothetical protein
VTQPLSPAAQAVVDAWLSSERGQRMLGDPACLAVALRAAGEQLEAAPGQSHQTPGITAAERQLRRWAAELEGQSRPGNQSKRRQRIN